MQMATENHSPLTVRPRRASGRPALLLMLMFVFALPMGLSPGEAQAESLTAAHTTHTERRRVVRRTRHTARHRHHHRGGSTTVVYARHAARPAAHSDHPRDPDKAVTRPARRDGPFLGMGLGVVDIDNDFGSEGGTGVNLSLGVREGNLAIELGLLAAAQPIERRGELVQDLTIGGVSADAKLYLPLSRTLEPYGLVGLGYYAVGTDEDESDFNTSLNLGGGLDLRLTRGMAIGGRFTHHSFIFDEPTNGFGATGDTWSALGTLTVYF